MRFHCELLKAGYMLDSGKYGDTRGIKSVAAAAGILRGKRYIPLCMMTES